MRVDEALARLDAAADLAARRGSLLFHLDLAAELARVALAANGVGVAALATLVDERGYRVIAMDDAPIRGTTAAVEFDADGTAVVLRAPMDAPPRAAMIAEAWVTASAANGAPGWATVVVPAHDARAPIEAYALAIAGAPEVVQLARHARLTLDPAGRRVLSREPLAVADGREACALRAIRDEVLAVPGAVPGEVHTYLSLKHGVPLVVATAESGLRWRVDGERSRRL